VTDTPDFAARSANSAAGGWSGFYSDSDFDMARLIRVATLYQAYLQAIDDYAPGRRGLEIGTGTGWAAAYLSHEGYEIAAIDRDSGILAKAVRLNGKFGGTARFLIMDLFHLGFGAERFDFAFHQGVLERFPEAEIRMAIREQLRVAKRVIFSVPATRKRISGTSACGPRRDGWPSSPRLRLSMHSASATPMTQPDSVA